MAQPSCQWLGEFARKTHILAIFQRSPGPNPVRGENLLPFIRDFTEWLFAVTTSGLGAVRGLPRTRVQVLGKQRRAGKLRSAQEPPTSSVGTWSCHLPARAPGGLRETGTAARRDLLGLSMPGPSHSRNGGPGLCPSPGSGAAGAGPASAPLRVTHFRSVRGTCRCGPRWEQPPWRSPRRTTAAPPGPRPGPGPPPARPPPPRAWRWPTAASSSWRCCPSSSGRCAPSAAPRARYPRGSGQPGLSASPLPKGPLRAPRSTGGPAAACPRFRPLAWRRRERRRESWLPPGLLQPRRHRPDKFKCCKTQPSLVPPLEELCWGDLCVATPRGTGAGPGVLSCLHTLFCPGTPPAVLCIS